MEEFITVCPRNCYSTCSFTVQVENNIIKHIYPYPGNLATPNGPCIKGLSYIERTHSPDRIIHPLRKTSTGKFKQITADEALERIAEKLLSLREKFGPQSVLFYRGSGMSGLVNEISNSFWKGFGGATTTYGNLCWPAGLEAVRLTLGTVKHNVPWDIENAKTIIIWGKNPAETNIQETAFIARAREKGSKVIVIDPRRTLTADHADLLLSPKPGTDGALALAIASVLIRKNLIDSHFINSFVKGFNDFCASLTISPEDCEKISGIPAGNIYELADIIGLEGPVTIIPGYGLQRHINGGQTIRAILSLNILTGNIGKPGAGFNYANLQSYIFDTVKEPQSYYPDAGQDFPFRRTVSMTNLGRDISIAKDPPLKGAWIERGNPILQSPDSGTVRKSFSDLEFVVVVEQFMTDTAAMADIILPARDIFEQSDIIGSYWSPYVCYKPAVITCPGEVMPESEIYYRLAKKMGLNMDPGLLPEPGNDNIEKWLETRIKGYSSLTLSDLKKGPVLAPGLQEIAYNDMKFETPSGKIELFSSEAHRKWGISPVPGYSPLESDNEKYPLCFLTPNIAGRIHSQFGNLDLIRTTLQEPAAELSPSDAKSRGIFTGDQIRMFNDLGEIITTARISHRVPAGIIVLPNGIWLNEGGGGNLLIAGRFTDIGMGAAFHDTQVQVEKADKHG
ncbi:MAG: molybdopterin-dependent oxidoreductase [Bacteroidales bacterium]|nr:molybdopterin-dependent oxidoreductase [Bacteroidales bacterium]